VPLLEKIIKNDQEDDVPRLIDFTFPLRETSINSRHEKHVHEGHISTLHVWPARRPLAASRAILFTALLPYSSNLEQQKEYLTRIGGKVIIKTKRKRKPDGSYKEIITEETEGGILRWGRENSEEYKELRELLINKIYKNKLIRVLDPFSGGGSIPLEAMRLGCEVFAFDLNPVAYFILKCTLEYPQRLNKEIPEIDYEIVNIKQESDNSSNDRKSILKTTQKKLFTTKSNNFTLADHVQFWGDWVLGNAAKEISDIYPIYQQKSVIAYLWARTVKCKQCGYTLPIFKTKWLCFKKDVKKKIFQDFKIDSDKKSIVFEKPIDLRIEALPKNFSSRGTLSKSGIKCPVCKRITIKKDDLQFIGQQQRFGKQLMAVVVDGEKGREYRLPFDGEEVPDAKIEGRVKEVFLGIPGGIPDEPTPIGGGKGAGRAFSISNYGLTKWVDIFTSRQLLAIGTLIKCISEARLSMKKVGYSDYWVEAICAYLSAALDRLIYQCNSLVRWAIRQEASIGIYAQFTLPMMWDFSEVNPLSKSSGSFHNAVNWVVKVIQHLLLAASGKPAPHIFLKSAILDMPPNIDIILTDPPYYDSIPYSDLMDFFHIWLKRTLTGLSKDYDQAFIHNLGPKWDNEKGDGELIDDERRFNFDPLKSKANYEQGMARSFQACFNALKPNGRLIIVFANKKPDAWEQLVSAIVKSGFVVNSSWPIQTEMDSRTRALTSAALSKSVWLVCKKRSPSARFGWDNIVLDDMNKKISSRLRLFWDAGIRGPDFVWAAIGPALEEYSKYTVIKKANEAGATLEITEFLRIVRRVVVNFVVGRVLSKDSNILSESGLDDITTYYILHRYNYGLAIVPIGACILYAVSCNLSDTLLVDRFNILVRTGSSNETDVEDDESSEEDGEGSDKKTNNSVCLTSWNKRSLRNLGNDIEGRPAPIIDQIHKLMQLWKQGDVNLVNAYIDQHNLRKNTLFHQILQALIELSSQTDEERSMLESISNHIGAKLNLTPRGDMGLLRYSDEKKEKEDEKDE
jgi:adenine-specific DNA methylase